MQTRVLVLGGGIAGLSAVRELHRHHRKFPDLSIRLVDRHRWSLFAPLLPDVISGRIEPAHITYPLEPFCRAHRAEFVHAEVTRIAPAEGKAETSAGTLEADYFIICLGCETNFYGNTDMQQHAAGLKSLDEGVKIRRLIREVLENRASTADGRGHVIVVGGGYTGFEAASHIAHYTHCNTGLPFERLHEVVEIAIVEKAPLVLGNTRPEIQRWATQLIESYGVEVRTGVTAASFEEKGAVRMTDGALLRDTMVVWTAGVTPGHPVASLGSPRLRDGRLEVDPWLRVKGMERVFAAGDAAGPIPPKHDKPLRLAWHFSEVGGKVAAGNLLRTLRNELLKVYDPRDPGYVIPLAPGHAVGIVLGVDLHGRLPFFFHYMLSTFYSQGWDNKKGVLGDLWSEMVAK